MPWTFYNSSGEAMVTHAESEATRAEMEAQTAVAHFVPPDLVKHSPGVAKAWCKFDGTGGDGSTITNNIAYGCDATTDAGTGDYTVNFSTVFSSTHYVFMAWGNALHHVDDDGPATGTYNFKSLNASHAKEDAARLFVVAFGDQ